MPKRGSLFSDFVFFSLFRHLASYLGCRVERMFGPIMFADRARRRSLFCGGFFLGLCDGGQALALLLHEEKAAENEGDTYDDSGSHGLNQSRL
jgi:hypothetical protein